MLNCGSIANSSKLGAANPLNATGSVEGRRIEMTQILAPDVPPRISQFMDRLEVAVPYPFPCRPSAAAYSISCRTISTLRIVRSRLANGK